MSLPNNHISVQPTRLNYLAPDNQLRVNTLYDFERGGVEINDSSQGLSGYNWKLWVSGDDVLVAREPYDSSTVLFTAPGITGISLSFDQNMQPCVAYTQSNDCKLWWFDSFTSAYVITDLIGCTSPLVCMDDKREGTSNYNDILLFYVRDGAIQFRQQRDRFSVERRLVDVVPGKIIQVGMTEGLRIQIRYRPNSNSG